MSGQAREEEEGVRGGGGGKVWAVVGVCKIIQLHPVRREIALVEMTVCGNTWGKCRKNRSMGEENFMVMARCSSTELTGRVATNIKVNLS